MDVRELTLSVNGAPMDYITFGSGKKAFVILAGMSLGSIRGLGKAIAEGYRIMTEDYTVYAFDHRRELPEDFTAADMAEDIACALGQLGVTSADMMGFSLGGMVLQSLAIDHPALVHAAVFCSSACRPNDTSRETFTEWFKAAAAGDVKAVNLAFYHRTLTEATYAANAGLMAQLVEIGSPEQCPGFATLSRACLTFDRAEELSSVRCPALVIGVSGDKVFSGEASCVLAEKLGCEVHLYEGLGHAACDEAPDFKERILRFYRSVK